MIELSVITGEKVSVIERCGCITLNYIYNGTKVANIVYFYKEEYGDYTLQKPIRQIHDNNG